MVPVGPTSQPALRWPSPARAIGVGLDTAHEMAVFDLGQAWPGEAVGTRRRGAGRARRVIQAWLGRSRRPGHCGAHARVDRLPLLVDLRDGLDEHPGVWMERPSEDRRRGTHFHDPALAQDHRALADVVTE